MQTVDDRPNEAKFQELMSLAHEMERLKIPGVAIGLITGDEEFTAGLRITSIENPLEVTPETLFQIGSTTKTITSTAVFRLIEQGQLLLDDLVRKHIPDFKVQDEDAAARATMRNLLDHSAGWQGDFFFRHGGRGRCPFAVH